MPDSPSRRATIEVLKNVMKSICIFKLDTGRFPESLEDLLRRPAWCHPDHYPPEGYLDEFPLDGWGSNIEYRYIPNSAEVFELISHGGHDDSASHEGDIIQTFMPRDT